MLSEEQRARADLLREKTGATNGTILEAEDDLADFAYLPVVVKVDGVGLLGWDPKSKRITFRTNEEATPQNASGINLTTRIRMVAELPALIEAALVAMEKSLTNVEVPK